MHLSAAIQSLNTRLSLAPTIRLQPTMISDFAHYSMLVLYGLISYGIICSPAMPIILSLWTNILYQEHLDCYIIDKWYGMARDLFLQDKTDVSLVDLHCICVPHWNHSKPIGAHGTVKSSKVPRFWMQRPLVISSEQVHHPIYHVSRKGFH